MACSTHPSSHSLPGSGAPREPFVCVFDRQVDHKEDWATKEKMRLDSQQVSQCRGEGGVQ